MVTKQTNSIENTQEFYKGNRAESILAHILRNDGYYVWITADLKERGRNGAPGARNEQEFITLPDLDVAKNGYRGFVEVKYKSKPSNTGVTGNRDEHGIGLKNWRMYCQARKEFGTDVYLFIYEGSTGMVLYCPIQLLFPLPLADCWQERKGDMTLVYRDSHEHYPFARLYYGPKMDKGGMIFFPRSAFGFWGTIGIAGNDIYEQLSFDIPEVEKRPKNIFQVTRRDGLL